MFARMKGRPDLGLHTLLGIVVVVVLPKLTAHYDTVESHRWISIGLLVTTTILALGEARLLHRWWYPGAAAYACVMLLAGCAWATGDRHWLLATPGIAFLAVAGVFAKSLQPGPAIIESAAFWLQPRAPEFIRPYCRATTVAWAIALTLIGVVVAATAFVGSETTARATLTWAPLTLLVLAILEYLFRMVWFRHYKDRPLDRLFSRLFPADRTERGRRSQEYLAEMRAEDAADPS